MHAIEPYFHWRNLYVASEDERSPFYGRVYNEFDFEHKIYNFLIHPQWDPIGSPTLFIKILFVDYESEYCIIELIGEWNDAIENDIMTFKRDIIEEISYQGIDKYILIGENVLNFHSSDDCYYEEWTEDNENGWVTLVNFHPHVKEELMDVGIDQYFILGGEMDELDWRTYLPAQLFNKVAAIVNNRLK